jgi:hypothetical protein
MSSKTTNYNLHKIDLTDAPPDITVLNQNWDTIDAELKNNKTYVDQKVQSIPTPDVSGQINTHNDDSSAHSDIRTLANNASSAASTAKSTADNHIANKNNPHGVTAAQVGAPTKTEFTNHTGNKSNPHGVTAAQVGAIPTSAKGAASGVASLDSSGKVPTTQLPEMSSAKTYTATIGNSWTEDTTTGVKSQKVAISGVTANHTAKVDHVYTGNGTSDSYATFVKEENQYLECITNGYAETYNGGITFYIFGDAPNISIPIVVEVV